MAANVGRPSRSSTSGVDPPESRVIAASSTSRARWVALTLAAAARASRSRVVGATSASSSTARLALADEFDADTASVEFVMFGAGDDEGDGEGDAVKRPALRAAAWSQ